MGRAVIDQAVQSSATLILAGRCGKRGLQRLFLGSTAYKLASEAPCSVWIGSKAAATERVRNEGYDETRWQAR